MIVCWEGLFATAIEEGDSTAPVSDKPTIRESIYLPCPGAKMEIPIETRKWLRV